MEAFVLFRSWDFNRGTKVYARCSSIVMGYVVMYMTIFYSNWEVFWRCLSELWWSFIFSSAPSIPPDTGREEVRTEFDTDYRSSAELSRAPRDRDGYDYEVCFLFCLTIKGINVFCFRVGITTVETTMREEFHRKMIIDLQGKISKMFRPLQGTNMVLEQGLRPKITVEMIPMHMLVDEVITVIAECLRMMVATTQEGCHHMAMIIQEDQVRCVVIFFWKSFVKFIYSSGSRFDRPPDDRFHERGPGDPYGNSMYNGNGMVNYWIVILFFWLCRKMSIQGSNPSALNSSAAAVANKIGAKTRIIHPDDHQTTSLVRYFSSFSLLKV